MLEHLHEPHWGILAPATKASEVLIQLSPPRDHPYWGAKGLPFSAPNVSPRRGGFDPSGGLTFDSEGSLYGFNLGGGLYLQGAVYKLYPSTAGDANWTFTIPYSFNGEPTSGPYGQVS